MAEAAGQVQHQQQPEQVAASVTNGDGEAAVREEFRSAFSHLEDSNVCICSRLTSRQESALAKYRKAFGLKSKDAWDLSQLQATQEELQQCTAFRDRLINEGVLKSLEDKQYCTDIMLLRYLRARDHHLERAHKMFLDTLLWRRQHQPWLMENSSTRTNKRSSDARIVGFDRQGRVVIYSSFARTDERTPDFVKINTICMMEKANLCVNAHSPGSVVWVNHFGGHHPNGFSWRDCNPKFAWAALDIFSNHYPECLATMIVVDPPSVWFGLWKMVKPLLPEKTQQKGRFIHSEGDNSALFKTLFDDELAAYITRLMHEDARVHKQ